jgi:SAM-dependent methyltransferase
MTNLPAGNHPTSGHYQGATQLFESEAAFKSYRRWIIKTIWKKFIKYGNGNNNPQTLEFGAGTGNLSEILREIFRIQATTIEIDSQLIEIITSKGFKNFKSFEAMRENNLSFDFIFSSNVLEHIENDILILEEMKSVLEPTRGILVLYVPAHQWLFSDLDRSVGHFRRYSKKSLSNKIEASGMKVLELHYADSLGLVATLAIKILGYKETFGIGSLGSMKVYDRFIHPASSLLDSIGMKYLVGCNIILVAAHDN